MSGVYQRSTFTSRIAEGADKRRVLHHRPSAPAMQWQVAETD